MDPKRPRTPEELSPDSEAHKQPAEQPTDEQRPEPPTKVKTHDQGKDDDATTGAVNPPDSFSSLDAGMQAIPDVAPDARAENLAIDTAAGSASATVKPFAQDAFAPPAIEAIVASLSAAPISDAVATVARDMLANWQDLPADFGIDNDNATADHRETIHDQAPEGDPPSASATGDFGAFMSAEPVEPPAGANADSDTFDRTLRASPAESIAIGGFLGQPNDSPVIQRGPLRTDDDSWRPSITLLSGTNGDSSAQVQTSDAALSPRATGLHTPTSDGGPPLARPILLVSVPDEQTRLILDEALAEAGRRDAKTIAEVAQQKVDDAFWLRACEERALYGGR